MRPVDSKFPVSQGFGGGATAGVDPYGNDPMAALVRQYGNYQPFGHAGEDIACPVGTTVHAMAAGKVLWADWGTNLPGDDSEAGWRSRWYLYKGFPGIVTVIQHPGWIGVYAHLSSNDAAPAGTAVREGQLIGYSGDTGGVAPHLHVEALVNLSYITQNGLIYGRTNPAAHYGSLAPAGSTSKGFLMALNDKQQTDFYTRVMRYLDAPVSAVPGKVWNETVLRGGKNVSVKQELADAKSEAQALRAAVAALAKNPDLTADQITAAVKAGIADGAVTVDVIVNGGK